MRPDKLLEVSEPHLLVFHIELYHKLPASSAFSKSSSCVIQLSIGFSFSTKSTMCSYFLCDVRDLCHCSLWDPRDLEQYLPWRRHNEPDRQDAALRVLLFFLGRQKIKKDKRAARQ